MGTFGKFVICLAALGGFIAWSTNYKVPEGFHEPGKLKLFMSTIRLMFRIDVIAKNFGFSDLLSPKVDPDSLTLSLSMEEKHLAGVRTVIYRPDSKEELLPAIVYFHGGAWILGSPETVHTFTVDLAKDLGAVVFSVDYRLAPDHPYPAPFDDCYKVAEHVVNNAKELQVDPARISLAGDSAGGNLAAAVATKFRDEGKANKIKLALLLYPVLQATDFQLPSYSENAYDGLLSRYFMINGWVLYALGKEDVNVIDDMTENAHVPANAVDEFNQLCGRSPLPRTTEFKTETWNKMKPFITDPYYAPLSAKDLRNMPPMIIVTMEQDVLKDEGFLYAERLRRSGIEVIHHHNKESLHGILTFKPIFQVDYQKAYDQMLPDLKKLL